MIITINEYARNIVTQNLYTKLNNYGRINKVLKKKMDVVCSWQGKGILLNMVALALIELPVWSIQQVPSPSPKCEGS
jgi:hypothetical protein